MSRKRTVIVGVVVCLLLVACYSAVPAEPTLNYTIGGCGEEVEVTRSGDRGEVQITVEDGNVHIEQKLMYVCCAELALTMEEEGNTLKVVETNVGEICRCMCEYYVKGSISKLAPGTYQVQVWGVQYKDVHPLELLGEATITL